MKAVKTIVATAVIVFALTTVAVAGVQHVGSGAGASDPAPVATTHGAQQGDSVTLSAQQFAALLHAVSRGDAQHLAADQPGGGAHARVQAHSQVQAQVRTQTHAATHPQLVARATHHAETHNVETHTRTHDSGSHAGTPDGSGHGGGCD